MVSEIHMCFVFGPLLVANYETGFFRRKMETVCFIPGYEFFSRIFEYILDKTNICAAVENGEIVSI
jgi:hypothetical protein